MRLTDVDRQRFRHLQKLGLDLRHFFDAGASNGRWSSRVSEDFPEAEFDLFEPLAEIAPAYREGLEETLSGHPKFRLHKVALGAECKRASMFLYPQNLVGSTALELGFKPQAAEVVEVDMLTIDYAIQEFRLPVPQVIKIDTQGCELAILRGASRTLPQVEALLLECWLTRGYGKPTPLWLEVAEFLRGVDFHLWDVGNGWRDEEGTLVTQDCFFLNARSRVSRLQDEARRMPPATEPVLAAASSRPAWLDRVRNLLWHP